LIKNWLGEDLSSNTALAELSLPSSAIIKLQEVATEEEPSDAEDVASEELAQLEQQLNALKSLTKNPLIAKLEVTTKDVSEEQPEDAEDFTAESAEDILFGGDKPEDKP